MHTSVKLNSPCEFINITPVNPLISKCQIKVCYVGDEPNRNRSIITKEVARQMANSLPGSPIVGFYNEETEDFEEHNRTFEVRDGKLKLKDATRPYGFVDLGAKVWFQKFLDDGENEHEYLMTEGYIWTGQYPESKRILTRGNNQSMELDDKLINASWSKDCNGKTKFFIINEAIVSKLCILGEEYEPCFEGSNITNIQFSFEDSFSSQLSGMITELKDLLNRGGTPMFTTYSVKVGDSIWNALYEHTVDNYSIINVCEDDGQKYAILQNKAEGKYVSLDFSLGENDEIIFSEEYKDVEDFTPAEEAQFSLEEVENFEKNFKKKEDKNDESDDSNSDKEVEDEKSDEKDDDSKEDSSEEDKEEDDEDEESEKKKESSAKKEDGKKYILEEVTEYVQLKENFEKLSNSFNELNEKYTQALASLSELQEFKLAADRKEKAELIRNNFFMLSEEDTKEYLDNLDKYSLHDIEAELSILCVRKKVNFSALGEETKDEEPLTYNLGGNLFADDSQSPWVALVMKNQEMLNL